MTEPAKAPFIQLEWKVTAIFAFSMVLVIIPFYNWLYRITVNFLGLTVFLVTIFSVLFTFFRHIAKLRFAQALINLALGVMVICVNLFIQEWRYQLTDYIIKERYCDLSNPLKTQYLLGGITEMRVDAQPGRTGAFENSSSCLTVACVEEFYYCSEAKIKIFR